MHPGAEELCDEVDQDCDPDTEGTGAAFIDRFGSSTDLDSTLAEGTASRGASWTSSEAGTLKICDTSYYVNLVLEHDVELYGVGDATLDGAWSGPVVTITGSTTDVLIHDLVLTGGDGDDSATASIFDGGGGIHCYGDPAWSSETWRSRATMPTTAADCSWKTARSPSTRAPSPSVAP